MSNIFESERWIGGGPITLANASLPDLEPRADNPAISELGTIVDRLRSWDGIQPVGLYFYGMPGTGKSHAAIGLARVMHDEIGAVVGYCHPKTSDRSTMETRSWLDSRLDTIKRYEEILSRKKTRAGKVDYDQKSVIIIDDVTPKKRDFFTSASEAIYQAGGLLIVTSNYDDPFEVIQQERHFLSDSEIALRDFASRVDKATVLDREAATANQDDEQSNSVRSRIASMFKFVHFTGDDRRQEQIFWD